MSHPKKENKSIGYKIGIIGSIASIIALLLIFFPFKEENAPQLTVFIVDSNNNIVLEHKGELNTSIGNRPMREMIGENGRTNFGDILPQYIGKTISIGFKAEGWDLINKNNTIVFDGEPIILKVQRDDSLGRIKGQVTTRDGQDFINKAEVMINMDTTLITDDKGIFEVILPIHMRIKDKSDGYKLTISKNGYKTRNQFFYPKSSEAEIRLEKLIK